MYKNDLLLTIGRQLTENDVNIYKLLIESLQYKQ